MSTNGADLVIHALQSPTIGAMAQPDVHTSGLNIPEYLTWEQLERLPEDIASQIELWNGRVVWLRRPMGEHQKFTVRLHNGLEVWLRKHLSENPEECWRVNIETNVFLGKSDKSDFLTPDFLIHRCLETPYQEVRAADVLLVGEVLSPSNTIREITAKKSRYASAGIPWYWEISLDPEKSAISEVRAFALESQPGKLPEGVRPLHNANYLLAGEWRPEDVAAVTMNHPFFLEIPWSELEF